MSYPPFSLNQESLRAIENAIIGYLPTLKKKRPMPSETIHAFQSLRLKLAPFLGEGRFPEGTVFPLSPNEIRLIEEALKGFRESIRHHFMPSQKQEITLQELDALRQYVHSYFDRSRN